ncbi:MAG TPA: MBOAT family O-acyltransferase [Rhodopila sp.]
MLFHTNVFIFGFLPVCLTGFFVTGRFCTALWALRWLVLSSLFFYAWWTPVHLPLLMGSIWPNHAIARRLQHSGERRAWLTAGIMLNLALLGWFKYADFLLHIVFPDAPALTITLPLAISFFSFQQIMFLVDTARAAEAEDRMHPPRHRCNVGPGQAAATDATRPRLPSLLTYAAFVSFFPHLIAGPIVRPSEVIPQLAAPGLVRPAIRNISDGLLIFLLGLGKKLVLADMFGGFADTGFDAAAHGSMLTFFEAWYATLSYALQIYFDFSGYSDMAIGLARMLNIRFPLNFDSPYQATDIADFWRRWHITLGGFLRDYLYIPLGGNRGGQVRQTVNLMATMLLCGLWHGAAWNFVIWGGLHGLLIVIHRQYRRMFRPLPRATGQALTLIAVTLAWVPFRAASLPGTMTVLAGMAGLHGIVLPRMILAALPPLALIADPVTVMPHLGDARTLSFPEVSACLVLGWLIVLTLPNIQRMTCRARHWALTGSFALSVQALFFAPHIAPFLYFQF